jgi:hypothetical protein
LLKRVPAPAWLALTRGAAPMALIGRFAFNRGLCDRKRPHDAVQRGWRDFRMAITSCDRNDAPLPKIWTLASLRAHEREQWRRQ